LKTKLGASFSPSDPRESASAAFGNFPEESLRKASRLRRPWSENLQEELLIQTEIFQILEMVEHHYEKSSIRLIPCRARILSGVPTALEHSEIGWFSNHEVDRSALAPADVPILAMLATP
jgi:8-oxo-dGTP diphosphatase